MPRPSLTGAEDPLNQLLVESMAVREGRKLASDLEGECDRIDAAEVCCCIVEVARVRKDWLLLSSVPVSVRWWLLWPWPRPARGKSSSREGASLCGS